MKKPVLFYVDDDANDLLLFEDGCREAKANFHLDTANDGEQALSYLQKVNDPGDVSPCPSLVLLDIKMPRINGFEILEWIRNRADFKSMPVVIFTSSKHEVDIRKAYELGANSYLVKTVDFKELIRMIHVMDQYWIALNHTISRVKT